MKIKTVLLTLVAILFLFSCSKDFSPLSNEQQVIFFTCGCDTAGIYIDFADTCSYDFINSLLSECDSVEIMYAELGIDLFLYADSGNAEYWFDYFKDDSLFYSLSSYTLSDSLILVFRFQNEEYYINYKDDIINYRNLHFKEIYIHEKTVVVKVPKNSETFWINYFKQFSFIEFVDILVACCG